MALVTTITLIFVFGAVTGGETFSELITLGVKKSPMIGVFCMAQSMIVTPIGSLIGEAVSAKVKGASADGNA